MLGKSKIEEERGSSKNPDSSAAAKKQKVNAIVEEVEDNNNKTGTSLSTMEKALQNTLVLQNIFKFLPHKDLQACQYVDPLWSSEVQHAMSQHPLLIIIMDGPNIIMTKTVEVKRIQFKVQDTADLLVQLENHGKGHEIWLTLKKFDQAFNGWQKFVEKFGYAVSYLDFIAKDLGEMSLPDFQKLLHKFPNLNYLSVRAEIPSAWKSHKETSPNQNPGSSSSSSVIYSDKANFLPQIKTISFGPLCDNFHPELLMTLFQMMPNLKNIFNFPVNCIPKSAAGDKLKLGKIKSIMFSRYIDPGNGVTEAELSKLDKMSREIGLQMAHLPLKMIQIDIPRGSWEPYKVLRSNKNNLEYLIIEPHTLPELLEYPEMKAVKKICLYSPTYVNKKESAKFFAQGFDVARTFPNLMEVTLKSRYFKLSQYVTFFPEDAFTRSYFQKVTVLDLKFENFGDLDSLEKVALLFPNVTRFSITFNFGWLVNRLDQILRLWPKLASLKLRVDLYTSDYSQRKFPLDLVFTGISARKCNELRKNKEKMDINIDDYRQEFAISKMADLKELTVVFGGGKSWTRFVPPFSHVTPFYGFQLVPDLKVTFAIPWDSEYNDKIRAILSPMEKYVIFNPDYEEPQDYYPEPSSIDYWC